MGRSADKTHALRLERRSERLAPLPVFLQRLLIGAIAGGTLTIGTLAVGIGGYRTFEHMGFLDAFLNASMLLGGMGPVAPLTTDAGKLFAGFYALWCGLVVLISASFLLAPVLHRAMHALHIEDNGDS